MQDVHDWVHEGTGGRVLCDTCRYSSSKCNANCFGCIVAWRTKDGNNEYFRQPTHGKED